MSDCIFCKIASGEIPTDFVYSDDNIVAFRDLNPQAPVHVLIIPRKHYASAAVVDDEKVFSDLMSGAVKVARALGLEDKGYRMVINTGEEGGQTVLHLHLHLLAGRNLGWPPG
ncbi:MAG: histidine triad nucleotide-binding protein [Synergistaceae bacterium]|nr:histidine triad nucleotide-binding protein [Synergistaceae bacterium]